VVVYKPKIVTYLSRKLNNNNVPHVVLEVPEEIGSSVSSHALIAASQTIWTEIIAI